MYKHIKDFAATWQYETEATMRTLEMLTDESLGQQITSDHRTLGRVAWHLVQTLHEMPSRTGLSFEGPGEDMRCQLRQQTSRQSIRGPHKRSLMLYSPVGKMRICLS